MAEPYSLELLGKGVVLESCWLVLDGLEAAEKELHEMGVSIGADEEPGIEAKSFHAATVAFS